MPATKISTAPTAPAETPKPARLRSPAYPGIDLEAAIKRAQEFYDREHRNAANAEVVVQHWGYKPTSGGGFVVIAALKAFGLVSDSGSGKSRKIQLSDLALRILLDRRPDSRERQEAIKQAALMPKIHASLWNKHGEETPSDANLAHELVFERKFNEKSVKDFIKEYRDTIAFAKLTESDKVAPEDGDSEDTENATSYIPKVGDYVQWESAGVLQFIGPTKLRGISTDGKFAFVEGSPTGIPVGELVPEKAPTRQVLSIIESRNPPSPKKNMQEDVFSLSEGRVVLQWPSPLSEESIQDLKDWLRIVERKITRSIATPESAKDQS